VLRYRRLALHYSSRKGARWDRGSKFAFPETTFARF
jgi:hypothetical protein